MALWNLFESRERKEKLSHLKQLMTLALADGRLEKSELAAIASVMSREGLTEEDFKNCMKNPSSISFRQPESDSKRRQYITDMVMLMMVDGDLDENEYAYCKLTAIGLGYKSEIVDALIVGIIEELKKKLGL